MSEISVAVIDDKQAWLRGYVVDKEWAVYPYSGHVFHRYCGMPDNISAYNSKIRCECGAEPDSKAITLIRLLVEAENG